MKRTLLLLLVCGASAACASDGPARVSPPLIAMEESLEWLDEPDDEAQRQALPAGVFTGVVVADARASLDAMLEAPSGLSVASVVENSPAAIAGLAPGDLLLEVRVADGPLTALAWPAEWRRVELEAQPGQVLRVLVDRAGAEREFEVTAVPRVRVGPRGAAQRFTEDQRVGLVVRTATEVEARAAALGPGGGAVVVGLTRESPWRSCGVAYGDLIRSIDGVEISHPQVLLDELRGAPADGRVQLEVLRKGELLALDAPLSRRVRELKKFSLPLLYSYSRERDATEHSALLGLVRWRSTPAAWDLRLLWWIEFAGGDANRLESL
ncbi:MAG: PDZ domain-containing protein [Planctomycetes bacterium]|nr:PDZ domain-containing protein [Planctomycetota bacterium]